MYSTMRATSSTENIPTVRGERSTACANSKSLNPSKEVFIVLAGLFVEQSKSNTVFMIDKKADVFAVLNPNSLQKAKE